MNLLAILLAASTALAFPQPDLDVNAVDQASARHRCPRMCINAVNECGVPYRGCFRPCRQRAPIPPPCGIVTDAAELPAAGLPTPAPEDNCSTRTVCVDAINECGMMYGGCIPDCKPWKLAKPPCPKTTSTPTAPYQTPY
ncbi:hypothetical protein E4U21_004203 [Claviceps maximensis]|nr:hypothetical protein E4U21_004203 [Claviceps maximensis]